MTVCPKCSEVPHLAQKPVNLELDQKFDRTWRSISYVSIVLAWTDWTCFTLASSADTARCSAKSALLPARDMIMLGLPILCSSFTQLLALVKLSALVMSKTMTAAAAPLQKGSNKVVAPPPAIGHIQLLLKPYCRARVATLLGRQIHVRQ